MKSINTIIPINILVEEKINWGTVLIDIVIIISSVYVENYWLLLLLFCTGSHKLIKEVKK